MSGSGDINQLNVQYQPDVDTASLPSNDMIALMAQIIKLTEVGAGVCFGGDATSMGGVGRTEATNIITAENYNQVDYFKNQLATAIAAIAMSQGRLEHDSTSAANAIVLKAGKIISGVQKNPLTNVNLPADYSTTLPLPKKSDKISFRFTPKFTNTQTDVTILVQDYNASALPLRIGNSVASTALPINYLKTTQEIEIKTGTYTVGQTTQDCFFIQDYIVGITAEYKLMALTADYGNWLICDGRAISRTQYSNLFTAIGSAFGSGDGSTTFNIPDLRGRVAGAIGQGSGLTNRTLGNNLGTETHTLSSSEVGYNTWIMEKDDGDVDSGQPRALVEVVKVDGVTVVPFNSPNQDFTFNVSPKNQTSHNNMQPTLFAGNYFIYAG
jgi:microcystin-dependent protein